MAMDRDVVMAGINNGPRYDEPTATKLIAALEAEVARLRAAVVALTGGSGAPAMGLTFDGRGVGATIGGEGGGPSLDRVPIVALGATSEIAAQYLRERAPEVTPQHLSGMRLILRAFERAMAGRPVDRAAVVAYRTELLAAGRSVTTANQHLAVIAPFLRWAGLDVARGLRLKQPKGRRAAAQRDAFTDEEVRRIFDRLSYATADMGRSYFWLPAIMAYSGARPEEIAQLRRRDVRYAVPDEGYLVFDFATLDGDVRRKNEASRRLVPVHPKLLELGLLVDLAPHTQDDGPLFPELHGGATGRKAEAPSRWFNRRWLRDRCGVKDRRKVLYSFRHTVATKLKHLHVEESLIAELLGHTNGSMTTGRYGKAYPVKDLARVVEMIDYHIT